MVYFICAFDDSASKSDSYSFDLACTYTSDTEEFWSKYLK